MAKIPPKINPTAPVILPKTIQPKKRIVKKRSIKKTKATPVINHASKSTKVSSSTNTKYWLWLLSFTALASAVLIVSLGTVLYGGIKIEEVLGQTSVKPTPSNTAPFFVKKNLAPLTGLRVNAESMARRPWAVVIGNLENARPQAGLASADIVFEAPAEAGITRYMAIFQSQLPTKVGPVRSARPYFNDWASSFGALYSHSGGSREALKILNSTHGNLQNVDEFTHEQAYYRDTLKKAPHNLFSDSAKFFNYITNRGWEKINSIPKLNFASDATNSTTTPPTLNALTVKIPYDPAGYAVRYDYRPQDKAYFRTVGGSTQFEPLNNELLRVKNVVLMFTDIKPIPGDPQLKINIKTTGQGSALIINNGQVTKGFWNLPDVKSTLTFTDEQGKVLPLASGNTWISVVDKNMMAKVVVASSPTP
ncbi:MAG: DUF3048 domain-containing protein [Patescibacteria group bacterium]